MYKKDSTEMSEQYNDEMQPDEAKGAVNENVSEGEETNQEESTAEPLSELDSLKLELADSKSRFIRLYADFENFRRRTAKEKIETIQNASEGLIKDLLPVLDDFERAQKSMETSQDVEALKQGVALIYDKLHKTLASKGLKAMESKEQAFDVELHECITQLNLGEEKKGIVIDEVEKGYFLHEKVIRYAKVVVGQ